MVTNTEVEAKKKLCGIVMPISECDGCGLGHWADVLQIIKSAANDAGLISRLVSDTMESNLIHKEILANIYNDDIVIVDVSGKNPNVFFELGVRMATQKPTVIVKDDSTTYPFDTGPNRFIEYPRDLRHPAMEVFKNALTGSLLKTIDHVPENSFIGQLGPFKIPKIEEKEVTISDAILERLDSMERRISGSLLAARRPLERPAISMVIPFKNIKVVTDLDGGVQLVVIDCGEEQIKNGIADFTRRHRFNGELKYQQMGEGRFCIEMQGHFKNDEKMILALASCIDKAIPF